MIRGASGGTRNIISPAAAANDGSNIVRSGSADELNSYLSAHAKAIVIFWAEWCGPCKAQNAFMGELAEEFPDVLFIKSDIEDDADTALSYGVRGVPAMVFFRNGQNAAQYAGAHVKSWYEEKIRSIFG